MFNFLKLFFYFLFHQKSFIIGSQERFEKRACFFLLKMIKKSVYKGIPYQIEISNTQNRLLTQNPPQTRGRRGEGGGGEWGGVGAEIFGFCGQIRALRPPGNSDTEGGLGK